MAEATPAKPKKGAYAGHSAVDIIVQRNPFPRIFNFPLAFFPPTTKS